MNMEIRQAEKSRKPNEGGSLFSQPGAHAPGTTDNIPVTTIVRTEMDQPLILPLKKTSRSNILQGLKKIFFFS